VTTAPEGPSSRDTRGTVAVAFCPSPPLLHPGIEGRPAPETVELRHACTEAVDRLLSLGPEVVVVVGAGVAPGIRFGPGDRGSLRGFGTELAVGFAGPAQPHGRDLPLPHALGAWLLDEAGFGVTRLGVGPEDLGGLLRDLPGPIGVLAMGDGSARRTLKAPGYLDEAAAPFDAAVARAIAAGDAAALADLDLSAGERLLAAGTPTWRAVGATLVGREIAARLHLDAAPFGVGYVVADWVAA
jgi:hypothetical protein